MVSHASQWCTRAWVELSFLRKLGNLSRWVTVLTKTELSNTSARRVMCYGA